MHFLAIKLLVSVSKPCLLLLNYLWKSVLVETVVETFLKVPQATCEHLPVETVNWALCLDPSLSFPCYFGSF